ncbi:hypothetical protein [Methylobacterium gnaphalii]|uniref:Uncharacterized protein n=1 Tax=Methylobacterium gnaphalii TaxID=1010610 RepID=A0A512JK72_9HYPH|nr:hypothetical protein [Methylobacterium gnaphalii]GEP10359.1 hypothetical protein MGN01_22040 [Methylobacterium gnaphalii]GJD68518.1 hypothetical protein MMMDOFMJ_1441 [Methylobacterium gnaphalii]GLS51287.1 hypothetical protein GCM10007885_41420 [Methylobacterium gnaphalii]
MLTLAACAVLAMAAWLCRRHSVRVAHERRNLLGSLAPLFDAPPDRGVDRAGFATLTGRYRACPIHLSLLADSLAFRRLPQLWCRIEVRVPIAGTQALAVLRRSTNVEFYSPAADMPARHEVPVGWPQDTLVRGTAQSRPLLDRLTAPAGKLLADPRLKEILVTPRGLRISIQACEGERGAYLLMRGNRFAYEQISPQNLLKTLDAAVDLSAALQYQEPCDARLPAQP